MGAQHAVGLNATQLGFESNGMLCSQSELQVGEGNDGLMELPADAPVGEDFRV
ncbi:hypothetical protein QCD79_32795, partial [Pseudomonas quasicaspiana]|nr:hypothetical protein [Pseudomonas quasicaspiana]